jgi:serine/threonine protein kinase
MDGQIMGTPGYMAPEQALGNAEELDEKTDIYALGAILYAILTLQPPVKGLDSRQDLAGAEGLGNIVVGPHFQADDPVRLLGLGGEHDDRQGGGGRLGTKTPADFQTVHLGQHEIQND